MKAKRSARFSEAMKLLEKGFASEALSIGNELASSDDEGDRLSGYLCQGAVYEDGGIDFPVDIDKSIHKYRQAALVVPHWITFNNLARMSMKRGGVEGFANALKYLDEASGFGMSPEIMLGYGLYFRSKPDPELETAKNCYRRAALRGRFPGFFGYSAVARQLGQPLRALGADVVRVVLGPLIFLAIGTRASVTF